MGAKGDLGVELNLDMVPVRETNMTPYEMMLSESQERMLMVLHPEKEAVARAVFVKWELDFATVGKTTDDLRFRVLWQGEEVANLPIKELGDEAPEYDRPWTPAAPAPALAAGDVPQMDVADALLKLVGGHQIASRRWVYEQYDTMIQGNSVQRPGGDAGVIRVDGHPTKGLAFTSDVNPRYCQADPYEGGKQAVAEAWRNLTATGADPLAATDNLNFGNPERPEMARASCPPPPLVAWGCCPTGLAWRPSPLRQKTSPSCWSAPPICAAPIWASRSICATCSTAVMARLLMLTSRTNAGPAISCAS